MGNKQEQEELLLNHSKNSRKGGLITMPFIIGVYVFLILTLFFFFFFFCILFTFVVWTCFCFVVVNESCEKLASYGLLPNMIIYLTTFYHMEAASASVLIALWTALSNGLGLFGAFLSDSYLGRFRAVAIGTISSLIVSLSSPNFYFLISICSV